MYVTTYRNLNDGEEDAFIRINKSLECAIESAIADTERDIIDYEMDAGDHMLDLDSAIERDDGTSRSYVRIINPNNNYEYQAFIIDEVEVED